MNHSGKGLCTCKEVVDEVARRVKVLFQQFLVEWWVENEGHKYLLKALELTRSEHNTLTVRMEDVETFNKKLANIIYNEYYRVYPSLCAALKNVISQKAGDTVVKEYFVAFDGVCTLLKVRELSSTKIGKLLKITGQVVRTYPVHPELWLATFMCTKCATLIPDVEQQFNYTAPTRCPNPLCGNRTQFALDVKKSVFVDFQRVIIQEVLCELPRGSIPRSVQVILRSDLVETIQSGDKCDFSGTLTVLPEFQYNIPDFNDKEKHLDLFGSNKTQTMVKVRDARFRMSFWACSVQIPEPPFCNDYLQSDYLSPEQIKSIMSPSEWNTIYNMSIDQMLLEHLADSMFPSIFGNDEVKQGLILMLFGGVRKTTKEMGSLRGDINVCLVGDPSTAKSQLLKHVADFCPRAIYTSGKGSTAAGLTAAVVRDLETSEFVLEAGALILCDDGVCCIDEFDKMDLHDKLTIHEAMEQQTVTITKAGVNATLNARTSILAAANPISGFYDRAKSLNQNILLSEAIISRFDLFFIMINESNEACDFSVASRIVDLHTNAKNFEKRKYEVEDIRRYINFARIFQPRLTHESGTLLVNLYMKLRTMSDAANSDSSRKTTVRQLESLIRLSEALARVNCLDEVSTQNVQDAYRLLSKAVVYVEQPKVILKGNCEKDLKVFPQKQLSISYEDYRKIANMIVHYLWQSEREDVRVSNLVNWYLEEVFPKSINFSQEEFLLKKQIVEKVIERLIYTDNILLAISKPDEGNSNTTSMENPLLIVHPNYTKEN